MGIPSLEEYHKTIINIEDDEEYEIETNHKILIPEYNIDMTNWTLAKELKKTDEEVANVYVICDEEEENTVIAKCSDKNLIHHELAIGYAINHLNMREFCKTYGNINAQKLGIDKDEDAICFERINGVIFSKFIEMDQIPDKEIVTVICRVLLALQRAYELIGFTHYDLHLNNIIVTETNIGDIISTKKDNYKFNIYYIPVIIDFEFSTIRIKDRTIGISGIELKGIYNSSNPSTDIHMFLCDCIRARPSLTKYLKYGIATILNVNTSLSDKQFRKLLVCCPHALYPDVKRKFSQIEYWPYKLTTSYEDAAIAILNKCKLKYVKRTSDLFNQ